MAQDITVARAQDAIPLVQSTADRGTRYPTPADDQRVFNKETGSFERWSVTLNRWVTDVLIPVINVQSAVYGAIGDGVADDTAALTKAFAVVGAVVHLPAGTYLVTSNLPVPACAGIMGAGDMVTFLQAGPAVTTLLSLGGACTLHQGYQVLGNTTANAKGIVFGDTEAGSYTVAQVRVKSFTGVGAVGAQCKNALKSQFDKLTVERNSENLLIDGTGGIAGMPTTLEFNGLVCIDAGLGGGGGVGRGLQIVTGDTIVFNEPVFDSNLAEALLVQPTTSASATGIVFTNPRFEDNQQGGSGTYQAVVDGTASAATARVTMRGGSWSQSTSTAKSLHLTGAGVAGYLLDNPQVLNAAGTLVIDAGASGEIVHWPRNLPLSCVSDTTGYGSWGTFTPTLVLGSGSVTYTTQTGTWVRTGRLVTAQVRIVVNTVSTPSGSLQIGNLPFLSSATAKGAFSAFGSGLAASATSVMVGQVDANATTARLYRSNGSGGLADPGADLATGCAIDATLVYEV